MTFRIVTLFLGFISLVYASEKKSQESLPILIHPKVFQMATCWLSDTVEPVVTEINLDAVGKNQNQFDTDGIKKRGDWVEYDGEDNSGHETLSYRLKKFDQGEYTVLFADNGGGSLTSYYLISFVITKRQITEDGTERTCNVLRILSVESVKN